jgi:hypothetical protein
VISTLPFGSVIAYELPDSATVEQEIPQSSADFRSAESTPVTLADLLRHVNPDSRRRYKRSFELIEEWQGKPADQILLSDLFIRLTIAGYRPFLAEKGYLEYTIQAYRKALKYLRNLAASLGVQVELEFKPKWVKMMTQARQNYCMLYAEYFESRYDTPDDVPVEEIDALVLELVKTNQATMSSARKARAIFLKTLRDCGFVKLQPVAAARDQRYGVPLKNLPEPLKSQVEALKAWATKSDSDGEWHSDWDRYGEEQDQHYIELRDVTASKVIDEICRLYGFVLNVCNRANGIDSLETLLLEPIFKSYRGWMVYERKLGGTGIKTRLGTLFSTLRQYPGASHINLTWVPALLQSIPVTPQSEVRARKSERIVSMAALETIPDLLRRERNKMIAHHARVEKAESSPRRREHSPYTEEKLAKGRATRLVRIAVLAQQELAIRFLNTLVWRNENLSECRILPDGNRPANLFKGPVVPKPGKDFPEWAGKLLRSDPHVELYQFEFNEEETKADREVLAVLPAILVPYVEEFLEHFRPLLVNGEDPGTLFVNQWGNAISQQQLEEAVQEATLKYLGRSVNPHLFRDIYAEAYLRDPANHADYMTLSKILWHGSPEITIKHYSWIFNESIGTSAAAEWAEKRDRERRRASVGAGPTGTRQSAARIPTPPPASFLSRQRSRRGR